MSSKIINIVLFSLLTICITHKANAGLVIGDLYSDNVGIQWEYVGSFDLTDGTNLLDPSDLRPETTYNGIEAALLIFDTLSADDIAISTNQESNYANIEDFIVNHNAFYDTFDGGALGVSGIIESSEDLDADVNGNTAYDVQGDMSAYVWDRALSQGVFINSVFKSVTTSVPEPSTLALFSLMFIGLASRRIKK
jgi:hypothetical protein